MRSSLRSLGWLQQLRRPSITPSSRTPILLRAFAYPKEGVFQNNSPPLDQTYPQYAPGQQQTQQSRFRPQNQHNNPQQQQPPPQYYGQQPIIQAPSHQYFGQQSSEPPPPPEQPRRALRLIPRWTTLVSALLFTYIGIYTVHSTLNLLEVVEPGSVEDEEELAALSEELDELLLVKQLREAYHIVEGEQKPAYQEWTAYEGLTEPWRRAQRFTTGALAGSAGVAAQRLFWNEEDGVLFLFVNFGPATTGWPTVVHGGTIATIADEALGRVALRRTTERTAVTASLEMKYIASVEPGQWFVFVVSMDKKQRSTDRKKYVQGSLGCCSSMAPSLVPDSVLMKDFHVHAQARALFVVPKGIELQQIADDF